MPFQPDHTQGSIWNGSSPLSHPKRPKQDQKTRPAERPFRSKLRNFLLKVVVLHTTFLPKSSLNLLSRSLYDLTIDARRSAAGVKQKVDTTLTGTAIFRRFASAEVESLYRRQERERQSGFNHKLLALALLIMCSYAVISPIFLRYDNILTTNVAIIIFIGLLAAYRLIIGTEFYLKNSIPDLVFYILILPSMYFFVEGTTSDSDITGWQFNTAFVYNLVMLLIFSCYHWIAALKTYIIWATFLLIYMPIIFVFRGTSAALIMWLAFAFIPAVLVLIFINFSIDQKSRKLFILNHALLDEQENTQRVLHNVLPKQVASRLQNGEMIADAFSDVTIVFIDIVGFSTMAKTMSPGHIVKMLNEFFQLADELLDLHGLEKVKTIGDAYMAVGGALERNANPQVAAIRFCLSLLASLESISRDIGVPLHLRCGINTGPVVGGVISTKRMSYDYWGDAINVASRIQDLAESDGITVSEATYLASHGQFAFDEPRRAVLKGIGEAVVYDMIIPQPSSDEAG